MTNEEALLTLKPYFKANIDKAAFLIVKLRDGDYVVGQAIDQPDGTKRVKDAERFIFINDAWTYWVRLMKNELEELYKIGSPARFIG